MKKSLKEKEQEYKNVLKYSHKITSKLYPGLSGAKRPLFYSG